MALRLGARRGWTDFLQSLRSAQDQAFYVITGLLVVGYLYLRRDDRFQDGSDLLVPTVSLPGILAGLLAFGVVIGPAYQLAMDREDGTLLRYKAVPNGLRGYFSGQLTLHSLVVVPQFLIILVPSFIVFEDLMHGGATGWFTFLWVLVLGLFATLPSACSSAPRCPASRRSAPGGCSPS